jgi:hypothetical protein
MGTLWTGEDGKGLMRGSIVMLALLKRVPGDSVYDTSTTVAGDKKVPKKCRSFLAFWQTRVNILLFGAMCFLVGKHRTV